MSPVALISIYSEHARNIYAGKKRYEYRTRRPVEEIEYLVLYETGDTGAVTGIAKIEGILEGTPSEIWSQTKSDAGITYECYQDYFFGREKAFAYRIGEVFPFNERVTLGEMGVSRPPQSFQYIEWADAEKLFEKKAVYVLENVSRASTALNS